MPRYIIERDVPGLGQMGATELHNLCQASNAALSTVSAEGEIQWIHSYATDDKLFCVYISENEEMIRKHASTGGFPCDHIHQVGAVLDPVTGER